MTGNVPQYGDLDDHHIVPAAWGKEHLEGNIFHSILNRTPLTAETNRNIINDRLPNDYLPEMIEANGESAVRAILESHFISPAAFDILLRNPFTPDDFEAFIAERQRTILEAIENLLIKDRLNLSPQLRELDQQVEWTEITLREVINETLADDATALPSHIQQVIKERLHRVMQKNVAFDNGHYEKLTGMLEFSDLRELQDIITSKSLWDRFVERFVNKETLNGKFNQLAELRNGIRHNRTVDEITRKEGEAALLWFKQVLNR